MGTPASTSASGKFRAAVARPKTVTRARVVTARQELSDVLAAAQALRDWTKFDGNLRRFSAAAMVERECHELMEFTELLDKVAAS